MWSFFNRKEREKHDMPTNQQGDFVLGLEDEQEPKPMEFAELVSSMGDLSDLEENDAALKFWIPEPVEDALQEICARTEVSLSLMLRQFFIIHCYGLYAFYVMKDLMPDICRNYSGVRYSIGGNGGDSTAETNKRIPTYWVVELGKNIAPMKVWIPSRVKKDLTTLATHVGLTRSNYAREIVISRLLGHGMLPKRPEMMTAEPLPDAENWAEDRDVSWKQVTKEEFRNYKLREERLE